MVKIKEGLRRQKEIEALAAQNATLQAKLDYIAMMTDVDIPEEEGTKNEREV